MRLLRRTAPAGQASDRPVTPREPVLCASRLSAGYGEGGPVVRDLDLALCPGEIVALLGPNGAGKTTTLLALSGALPAAGGTVAWAGRVTTAPLHQRARGGLAFVPEDRSVIMALTVRENLRVGRADPELALATFPELADHLDRRAGLLSGGQQQMVALARALARRPAALLADELSLGLAPKLVDRLLGAVRAAADGGLAVLLVEQHVRSVLGIADRVVVLRHGRVAWTGPAERMRADPELLLGAYLPPA